MDVLIGADFVPTKSNTKLFELGDISTLLGPELLDICSNANYRIFNLETPLCDAVTPINKCGPNLRASTKDINAYKKLNVSAFTLANNHIKDQGSEGIFETIDQLEKAGINYFGAGRCLKQAKQPFFINMNGKQLGFYACTEHEFSIATENSAGACPFDPLYSLDDVSELKEICDYVVVLYHGGKEHYRYPSPQLQKTCRRLVEKGADLVICQHSHCIGCEESYENGKIVYGQGNFLFDDCDNECWKTGMLLGIDVGEHLEYSYYPVKKEKNLVRLAAIEEKEKILAGYFKRTEEIKSQNFVIKKYGEFADSQLDHYLLAFAGKRSRLNRILNILSRYKLNHILLKKKYDRTSMTVIRNFVECEAHRELVLNAITRSTEDNTYYDL